MMMFIMLSMAGVPPFIGFWAKLTVLQALVEANLMWLAILAVVGFFAGGLVSAHFILVALLS